MVGLASFTLGDASGFAALILVGVSAAMMLFRSTLLKFTRNLGAVRAAHIAVSTFAGVFLVIHLAYLFAPPSSAGLDLGYAAMAASVAVWISGTAFLERLRDSLFFHGTLASSLVALSLVHAASTGANIPGVWSEMMLGTTAMIMGANAAFHVAKAMNRG